MNYICNKQGATVTVFAPYDCKNACPFCINKKDYKKNQSYDIEHVKNSMIAMDKITPNCDFVFTGGEPLADIAIFTDLVNVIKSFNMNGSNHKLFVNTTLPIKFEDIERLNTLKDTITEFNVSRHLKKYVEETPDEWIELLKIPVRINCVLFAIKDKAEIIAFLDRWANFSNITSIQFRDNYINVHEDNLFNFKDNIIMVTLIEILGNNFKYNEEEFRWNIVWNHVPISFHRTQCYSKIKTDENIIIGDIIIDPRGNIMDDWNEFGEPLNLDKYKKAIHGE